MSGMEGIVIFTALGVLLLSSAVITAVVIAKSVKSHHGPVRANRYERAKNQAEVEDWIGRTKGADHVKRMRGEG